MIVDRDESIARTKNKDGGNETFSFWLSSVSANHSLSILNVPLNKASQFNDMIYQLNFCPKVYCHLKPIESKS